MTVNLAKWIADESANLPDLKSNGWAVMGFPLWGAKYFDRFERYCLASMRAPENLGVLESGAALVIWTQERGREALRILLARHEIEFVIRTIPDELITGYSKYQLLAAIERLLIRTAAKNGRGYTGVFPDFITSERYYATLRHLSRHHQAIAHLGLTATVGDALTASIEPFRRREDGVLIVPARDLGDIGLRHLHPIKGVEVTDEKALPACHVLWWRGSNYVRIHSPHNNPAWMSPGLCRMAPNDDAAAAAGLTVDAVLPDFLGPRAYHPAIEDELVVTDLYDLLMDNRPKVSLSRWPMAFKAASLGRNGYVPYFRTPSMVPVHEQVGALSDAEIERQFGAVLAEIRRPST